MQGDTLSELKYVHFEVKLYNVMRRERKVYDFAGTDWESFKQRLEKKRDELQSEQDDLNKRAEYMQRVCKEVGASGINSA